MNATTTATLESLANQAVEIVSLTTRLENLKTLDLDEKQTLKALSEKINELVLVTLELGLEFKATKSAQVAPVSRNRGPASEKVMTEDDARRVMLGDLKDDSHKEAAEKLGLSYGQIYSARKGFTFKPVYKEMIEAIKATQATL